MAVGLRVYCMSYIYIYIHIYMYIDAYMYIVHPLCKCRGTQHLFSAYSAAVGGIARDGHDVLMYSLFGCLDGDALVHAVTFVGQSIGLALGPSTSCDNDAEQVVFSPVSESD